MSNNSEFTYTIYIRTSANKVWDAITKPALTRQYWGHENISDWQKGSKWHHIADDSNHTVRLVGEVLEIIPQKKLVLTWADPNHLEDNSRVIFKIKAIKDAVCLKILHDNFKPDSKTADMIRIGWPMVLSSMKSFLETGTALITWEKSKNLE